MVCTAQMVYIMLPRVYNSWKLLHFKYISQCGAAFVDCNSKGQGYKPYKVVLLTNISIVKVLLVV